MTDKERIEIAIKQLKDICSLLIQIETSGGRRDPWQVCDQAAMYLADLLTEYDDGI